MKTISLVLIALLGLGALSVPLLAQSTVHCRLQVVIYSGKYDVTPNAEAEVKDASTGASLGIGVGGVAPELRGHLISFAAPPGARLKIIARYRGQETSTQVIVPSGGRQANLGVVTLRL
jgi:hypothetical protein